MGFGDDIMATAYAAAVRNDLQHTKIVFGDGERAHWSDVFRHNPNIAQPGEPSIYNVSWVKDYPGHRHYIDYAGSRPGRFHFKPGFRAPVGELHFTDAERRRAHRDTATLAERFIVIEPHVKGTVSAGNKDWGIGKWTRLADRFFGRIALLQLGPEGTPRLGHGVDFFETGEFRTALALLARSAGFIGTDGGLHHAAAALGLPAVVLWGGYSSPDILGYPFHRNIHHAHSESPCGRLEPCEHCRAAMARITIDEVASAVVETFK